MLTIAYENRGVPKSDAHKEALSFSRLPANVKATHGSMEEVRLSVKLIVERGGNYRAVVDALGVSVHYAYKLIKRVRED